jgi:hypothetical protein
MRVGVDRSRQGALLSGNGAAGSPTDHATAYVCVCAPPSGVCGLLSLASVPLMAGATNVSQCDRWLNSGPHKEQQISHLFRNQVFLRGLGSAVRC